MPPEPQSPSRWERLKEFVLGPPLDLQDKSLLHRMALIPILAWVGLGADGLSSSAYGPEECMKAVREHRFLAIPLGVLMAVTVFVISACYSRIIEVFPKGGGGYVVTTALLGRYPGLVAGCALLIDYVLTVSVSVAAAMAALFSFLPPEWAGGRYDPKLICAIAAIALLVILNLRGVKESVGVLAPVFMIFVITHLVIIVGGIAGHLPDIPDTIAESHAGFQNGLATLGLFGLIKVFFHAYSLGGGTYTGIEAVSNGIGILREPRVKNGKRTMVYMSLSLAFTAAGLLVCYLLWDVEHVPHKTMNAVLVEKLAEGRTGGQAFVWATLLSEAAILLVAAQAGFIAGPRVLADMALDSWAPHRFAALSERLNAQNGIVMMGLAAVATLIYSGGELSSLIVMYSINVFITFTLAIFGMLLYEWKQPKKPGVKRRVARFVAGTLLCATILVITIVDKFGSGGWITLLVTGILIVLAVGVRRHYESIQRKLEELRALADKTMPMRGDAARPPALQKDQPVAALLVGGYNGTGIHTMANIMRAFPGHYKGFIFMSVAVVDSGEFKGEFRFEALKQRTEEMLQRYVRLANSYGMPAEFRFGAGTEVVDTAADLCREISREYPRVTFFTGKVIFERDTWWERILHNQTASAIQRRLHWEGLLMVIMPMRMR